MAAKKLVRDLVLLGRPLRLHLSSQPQALSSRLRLITPGGHLCNRRYGVFNEFSKKVKAELSRISFFPSSPEVSLTFQKPKEVKAVDLAKKGHDIVRDELSDSPGKRKHMDHAPTTSTVERSTRTDVPSMQCKWEALKEKHKVLLTSSQNLKGAKLVDLLSKGYDTVRDELSGSPSERKHMDHAPTTSTFVENVGERWKTSDNPVLHEIKNLDETIFQETETTASMREIRCQDQFFSLPEFVAEVQKVVKPVLNAYIKGDVETLKKYCSSEIIERCKAEHGANKNNGIFLDNKILHLSDVDIRETKMLGTSPILIVSFLTRQICCVRDRNGAITKGSEDPIHNIYYEWAMQQVSPEELGEDAIYPIWRLRAMRQISVNALI